MAAAEHMLLRLGTHNATECDEALVAGHVQPAAMQNIPKRATV